LNEGPGRIRINHSSFDMFAHGNPFHLTKGGKRKDGEQYQKSGLHGLYAISKLTHLSKKRAIQLYDSC